MVSVVGCIEREEERGGGKRVEVVPRLVEEFETIFVTSPRSMQAYD